MASKTKGGSWNVGKSVFSGQTTFRKDVYKLKEVCLNVPHAKQLIE